MANPNLRDLPATEPISSRKQWLIRASAGWPDDCHPIDGLYVERFWLPTVGPSVLWMARLLARNVGRLLEADYIARSVGLDSKPGRHGALHRTLSRAHNWEIIDPDPTDTILYVRMTLPSATARQIARWPVGLQQEHRHYLETTR